MALNISSGIENSSDRGFNYVGFGLWQVTAGENYLELCPGLKFSRSLLSVDVYNVYLQVSVTHSGW